MVPNTDLASAACFSETSRGDRPPRSPLCGRRVTAHPLERVRPESVRVVKSVYQIGADFDQTGRPNLARISARGGAEWRHQMAVFGAPIPLRARARAREAKARDSRLKKTAEAKDKRRTRLGLCVSGAGTGLSVKRHAEPPPEESFAHWVRLQRPGCRPRPGGDHRWFFGGSGRSTSPDSAASIGSGGGGGTWSRTKPTTNGIGATQHLGRNMEWLLCSIRGPVQGVAARVVPGTDQVGVRMTMGPVILLVGRGADSGVV